MLRHGHKFRICRQIQLKLIIGDSCSALLKYSSTVDCARLPVEDPSRDSLWCIIWLELQRHLQFCAENGRGSPALWRRGRSNLAYDVLSIPVTTIPPARYFLCSPCNIFHLCKGKFSYIFCGTKIMLCAAVVKKIGYTENRRNTASIYNEIWTSICIAYIHIWK